MTGLAIAMLAGFAGSFHCVGMCGGFACGLAHASAGSRRALLFRSLLYNSGRIVTYAFIGALAGLFGAAIIGGEPAGAQAMSHAMHHGAHSVAGHGSAEGGLAGMVLAGEIGLAQRLLSATAGLLMLVMALELLGLRRHLPRSWSRIGGEGFARALSGLLFSRNPAAPLALGVANGFLPCPLVYAFAATAAASGAVEPAVLTMVALGLGTLPAMFLMSAAGLMLTPAVRLWSVRAAGAFVFAVGLVTLLRGVLPGLLHGGAHAMPSL